jgi:hypothetical protein
MATFYTEAEIDISPREYLNSLDESEKQYLIELLQDEKLYIRKINSYKDEVIVLQHLERNFNMNKIRIHNVIYDIPHKG